MKEQFKIQCHITHYKPSEVFYIIYNKELLHQILNQLKSTNITVDNIIKED